MSNNITKLSLSEASTLLIKKELSSEELCRAYINNINEKENTINAYITLTSEQALEKAKEIDSRRIAGESLSPLAGIPYSLKDNICTKNIPTTCGSKMLKNFVPPYNAEVVDRLNKEEALLIGKTNMDEFAMGSTTENSYFKITKNPRDIERVPGGSSGGSAASVAAEETAFSLGSDTGGSIRQPASFCGVVGMKPTYGSVSRRGLVAFASSLDQIGSITKNVLDSALVLNTIAGHDKGDSTSVDRSYPDYAQGIYQGVKGMRIGLLKELFHDGIESEIKASILKSAKVYEALGAEIVELSLPNLKHALPAYYIISSAEASSNLARFDGIRYGYRTDEYEDIDELYKKSRGEGFGSEVKKRIILGTFVLSSEHYDSYYKRALQVRTLIARDFSSAFKKCDVILSPAAPTTAYKINKKTSNPLKLYMGDIFTAPVNIAGIPALTLPCAIDKNGLPIGMQLIGKAFDENTLYRAGYAFEREIGTFESIKVKGGL
ncbi:Asp-tRNA(Asn)/Glu-tRNA(Gln) amidotransferase subunit GatA [Alloiococcus sp. CFN-8]|uniref:Asp-tRNA(Asn)/Glu-tRNA(Gln) amidotransferase subunit GatA n=1 Tax=Alloiococcus sp. CFN-8 TaxID=3416081 RepID=UPI003CF04923